MPVTHPAGRTTASPSYGYGIFFIIINIALAALFFWQLPPQIPLFYSLPQGINQLADKVWFLLLPAFSVAVWISYILISRLAVKSTIYISVLKWLHLLCLFLATVTMVHILLITL